MLWHNSIEIPRSLTAMSLSHRIMVALQTNASRPKVSRPRSEILQQSELALISGPASWKVIEKSRKSILADSRMQSNANFRLIIPKSRPATNFIHPKFLASHFVAHFVTVPQIEETEQLHVPNCYPIRCIVLRGFIPIHQSSPYNRSNCLKTATFETPSMIKLLIRAPIHADPTRCI